MSALKIAQAALFAATCLPLLAAANGVVVEIRSDTQFVVRADDPPKSPAKAVTVANGDLKPLVAAVTEAVANTKRGFLLVKADEKQHFQALMEAMYAGSALPFDELRLATPTRSLTIISPITDKTPPAAKLYLGVSKAGEFSVCLDACQPAKSPAALRDALAALRKRYGSLFVQLAADRDAPVGAFAEAVVALQGNGIVHFSILVQNGGRQASGTKDPGGDPLVQAKQRMDELEAQQKRLMEQTK